jgi:hypothetical protein
VANTAALVSLVSAALVVNGLLTRADRNTNERGNELVKPLSGGRNLSWLVPRARDRF